MNDLDLIPVKTKATLEDRYQLLNKLIDAALFRFHPDYAKGQDAEIAESMTRGLLDAKERARRIYRQLNGKG